MGRGISPREKAKVGGDRCGQEVTKNEGAAPGGARG